MSQPEEQVGGKALEATSDAWLGGAGGGGMMLGGGGDLDGELLGGEEDMDEELVLLEDDDNDDDRGVFYENEDDETEPAAALRQQQQHGEHEVGDSAPLSYDPFRSASSTVTTVNGAKGGDATSSGDLSPEAILSALQGGVNGHQRSARPAMEDIAVLRQLMMTEGGGDRPEMPQGTTTTTTAGGGRTSQTVQPPPASSLPPNPGFKSGMPGDLAANPMMRQLLAKIANAGDGSDDPEYQEFLRAQKQNEDEEGGDAFGFGVPPTPEVKVPTTTAGSHHSMPRVEEPTRAEIQVDAESDSYLPSANLFGSGSMMNINSSFMQGGLSLGGMEENTSPAFGTGANNSSDFATILMNDLQLNNNEHQEKDATPLFGGAPQTTEPDAAVTTPVVDLSEEDRKTLALLEAQALAGLDIGGEGGDDLLSAGGAQQQVAQKTVEQNAAVVSVHELTLSEAAEAGKKRLELLEEKAEEDTKFKEQQEKGLFSISSSGEKIERPAALPMRRHVASENDATTKSLLRSTLPALRRRFAARLEAEENKAADTNAQRQSTIVRESSLMALMQDRLLLSRPGFPSTTAGHGTVMPSVPKESACAQGKIGVQQGMFESESACFQKMTAPSTNYHMHKKMTRHHPTIAPTLDVAGGNGGSDDAGWFRTWGSANSIPLCQPALVNNGAEDEVPPSDSFNRTFPPSEEEKQREELAEDPHFTMYDEDGKLNAAAALKRHRNRTLRFSRQRKEATADKNGTPAQFFTMMEFLAAQTQQQTAIAVGSGISDHTKAAAKQLLADSTAHVTTVEEHHMLRCRKEDPRMDLLEQYLPYTQRSNESKIGEPKTTHITACPDAPTKKKSGGATRGTDVPSSFFANEFEKQEYQYYQTRGTIALAPRASIAPTNNQVKRSFLGAVDGHFSQVKNRLKSLEREVRVQGTVTVPVMKSSTTSSAGSLHHNNNSNKTSYGLFNAPAPNPPASPPSSSPEDSAAVAETAISTRRIPKTSFYTILDDGRRLFGPASNPVFNALTYIPDELEGTGGDPAAKVVFKPEGKRIGSLGPRNHMVSRPQDPRWQPEPEQMPPAYTDPNAGGGGDLQTPSSLDNTQQVPAASGVAAGSHSRSVSPPSETVLAPPSGSAGQQRHPSPEEGAGVAINEEGTTTTPAGPTDEGKETTTGTGPTTVATGTLSSSETTTTTTAGGGATTTTKSKISASAAPFVPSSSAAPFVPSGMGVDAALTGALSPGGGDMYGGGVGATGGSSTTATGLGNAISSALPFVPASAAAATSLPPPIVPSYDYHPGTLPWDRSERFVWGMARKAPEVLTIVHRKREAQYLNCERRGRYRVNQLVMTVCPEDQSFRIGRVVRIENTSNTPGSKMEECKAKHVGGIMVEEIENPEGRTEEYRQAWQEKCKDCAEKEDEVLRFLKSLQRNSPELVSVLSANLSRSGMPSCDPEQMRFYDVELDLTHKNYFIYGFLNYQAHRILAEVLSIRFYGRYEPGGKSGLPKFHFIGTDSLDNLMVNYQTRSSEDLLPDFVPRLTFEENEVAKSLGPSSFPKDLAGDGGAKNGKVYNTATPPTAANNKSNSATDPYQAQVYNPALVYMRNLIPLGHKAFHYRYTQPGASNPMYHTDTEIRNKFKNELEKSKTAENAVQIEALKKQFSHGKAATLALAAHQQNIVAQQYQTGFGGQYYGPGAAANHIYPSGGAAGTLDPQQGFIQVGGDLIAPGTTWESNTTGVVPDVDPVSANNNPAEVTVSPAPPTTTGGYVDPVSGAFVPTDSMPPPPEVLKAAENASTVAGTRLVLNVSADDTVSSSTTALPQDPAIVQTTQVPPAEPEEADAGGFTVTSTSTTTATTTAAAAAATAPQSMVIDPLTGAPIPSTTTGVPTTGTTASFLPSSDPIIIAYNTCDPYFPPSMASYSDMVAAMMAPNQRDRLITLMKEYAAKAREFALGRTKMEPAIQTLTLAAVDGQIGSLLHELILKYQNMPTYPPMLPDSTAAAPAFGGTAGIAAVPTTTTSDLTSTTGFPPNNTNAATTTTAAVVPPSSSETGGSSPTAALNPSAVAWVPNATTAAAVPTGAISTQIDASIHPTESITNTKNEGETLATTRPVDEQHQQQDGGEEGSSGPSAAQRTAELAKELSVSKDWIPHYDTKAKPSAAFLGIMEKIYTRTEKNRTNRQAANEKSYKKKGKDEEEVVSDQAVDADGKGSERKDPTFQIPYPPISTEQEAKQPKPKHLKDKFVALGSSRRGQPQSIRLAYREFSDSLKEDAIEALPAFLSAMHHIRYRCSPGIQDDCSFPMIRVQQFMKDYNPNSPDYIGSSGMKLPTGDPVLSVKEIHHMYSTVIRGKFSDSVTVWMVTCSLFLEENGLDVPFCAFHYGNAELDTRYPECPDINLNWMLYVNEVRVAHTPSIEKAKKADRIYVGSHFMKSLANLEAICDAVYPQTSAENKTNECGPLKLARSQVVSLPKFLIDDWDPFSRWISGTLWKKVLVLRLQITQVFSSKKDGNSSVGGNVDTLSLGGGGSAGGYSDDEEEEYGSS